MGVELTRFFDGDEKDPNVKLNLGDLDTLTEQLQSRGNVARWQAGLAQTPSETG